MLLYFYQIHVHAGVLSLPEVRVSRACARVPGMAVVSEASYCGCVYVSLSALPSARTHVATDPRQILRGRIATPPSHPTTRHYATFPARNTAPLLPRSSR